MLWGMALEIQGAGDALLDDPLDLRVRGAGPDLTVVWRARLRDDDERVWRSTAALAPDLPAGWGPAKGAAGPIAALLSLRPVSLDVRAELEDGRAVKRTITRRLVAKDVRVRKWRDGAIATLHRPAPGAPTRGTLVIDATARAARPAPAGADPDVDAGDAAPAPARSPVLPDPLTVALLAAPLLASRGVLVLVVAPGRGSTVEAAAPLLAAVPGAAAEPIVLLAAELPVPPGVPSAGGSDRDAAWDALLARLDARPRVA
jgi:hypothetical protein